MSGLLAVFSGCYLLVLRLLSSGFSRLVAQVLPRYEQVNHLKVTVLVPFRNEAEALPELISALRKQDYPADLLEIIFIDDHSEDNSVVLTRSSGFTTFNLPSGIAGKKRALDLGIQKTSGELILTTDADCRPGPCWVSSMVSAFQDDQVQMALGPVRLIPARFFSRMQAMEFGVLQAVTCVAAETGHPVMANGANLCYRRTAYENVGGYSDNFHIASGDDQFLLRKFVKLFPYGITYVTTGDATVSTPSTPDLKSFIRQRIRWASKWRDDLHWPGSLMAPAVVVIQMFTWLALPYAFWSGNWWLVLLWVARCLVNWSLIRACGRFFGFPVRLHEFLLLELIFPLYTLIIAIISAFWRGSWKGRPLV